MIGIARRFLPGLQALLSQPASMLVLAAAALLLAAPSLRAQTTVTLTADRDNTLYEDSVGDVSSGASPNMIAGHTNGAASNPGGPSGFKRRALVHFNTSSIPAGSTITAATLTLYLNQVSSSASTNTTITVHKVLANWGEGTSTGNGQGGPATTNDATWTHRLYPGTTWSALGGQFTAAASDSTVIGLTVGTTHDWTSATVIADVQNWVNTPANNFGWLLKGDEINDQTTRRFSTHEDGTAARRPKLTITYTSPTGACCQNGSCSVITQAACTAAGGTYQGNATSCSPNPCPPAVGRCCTNNVCSIQTQAACTAGGGTYLGDGGDCTPDPCAAGTQVTLLADKDNTLYQTTDGSLSNGLGTAMIMQSAGLTNLRRRGVIHFNLSSIPANATITSATLRLYLLETSSTGAITAVVHKLTSSFGEGTSNATGDETAGAPSTVGDATWIHRSWPFTSWTTAGGDFNAGVISASASVGPGLGFHDWAGAQLTANVQEWVANAATNNGWVVKLSSGNEGSVFLVRLRVGSRNNSGIGSIVRPQLVLTYTLPPPTGACCASDGTCTIKTQSQCAATGGFYSGDNTTCTPNLCPQPTGACCFNTGLCSMLTEAACNSSGGNYQGNFTDCATAVCPLILTPFAQALTIPPVAQPTFPGGTNYLININEFTHTYHPDLPPTRAWGYNSSIPGPTFLATKGTPISVTWHNNLRNTAVLGQPLRTTHLLNIDTCLHGPDVTGQLPVTVTHFHGGKVDPVSDGNPDDAFRPGQSSPPYLYPNDQRASTLWYHDHALGITRLNVMVGLAGAYVLKDPAEDVLNLPSGEFDVPLIIQDRDFNPDGTIKYNSQFADNFFGKFMLVNGKVWPYMDVKVGKYRFRMVNGCNTRVLTLGVTGQANVTLIGTEQGLLREPLPISTLTLAPGERADVVIEFFLTRQGVIINLFNTAPAPFPAGDPNNDLNIVMQFRVQNVQGHTAPIPPALVSVPPIPPAQATTIRTFSLRNLSDPFCMHGLWLINDLMWNDVVDFPRIGSTEIWEFVNRSALTHPMHVHLVSFQILNRQAYSIVNNQVVPTGPLIPPPPEEAGWKDTVQSHPNQITRVIMKFDGFAGRYPFHCHILEHEDHEMMRQFDVLCDPPAIVTPQSSTSVPLNGTATFTIAATGDVLNYGWQKEGASIADGPTPWGSIVSGATTPTLTISNAQFQDQGRYTCRVYNVCGPSQQPPDALLTVTTCPADYNHDGNLDPDDLGDYITCYFTEPPCPGADYNGDSDINPDDLGDFITAYFTGC